MNQKAVDNAISELNKLKKENKTIGESSVNVILFNVKNSFGINSDEFATVIKAADKIFKAE